MDGKTIWELWIDEDGNITQKKMKYHTYSKEGNVRVGNCGENLYALPQFGHIVK